MHMAIEEKIHFIHFGKKPLDDIQKERIESFRRFNPSFEIKIWTDRDFDFSAGPQFVQDALLMKNYAYLSDYYRFVILRDHGGIYCDTDVECFRPLDDLLDRSELLECEFIARNAECIGTAIMGFEKGHLFPLLVLDYYNHHPIIRDGKIPRDMTNQFIITNIKKYCATGLDILPYGQFLLYNHERNPNGYTEHHADFTWGHQIEVLLYTQNNKGTIRQCLDSLKDQHVIVCDNSTDGTQEILKEYDIPVFYNCQDFLKTALSISYARIGVLILHPWNIYKLNNFFGDGQKIVSIGPYDISKNDVFIPKKVYTSDIQDIDKFQDIVVLEKSKDILATN